MKGFVITLLLFSFLLVPLATGAGPSGGTLPSLEWQKVNLQDQIQGKVSRAVSSILTPEQFVVEVDIFVNKPSKPSFNKNGDDGAGDDEAKAAEEAKKNKYRVRASDINPKDAPQDYLVFAKVGLEAPLVENLFAEGKDKDEKNKKEMSEYEYLWKYNESMNIFNNLESATIYVYLDNTLLPETVESVKKLLGSLKLPLGDVTPEFVTSQIALHDQSTIPTREFSLVDILGWVSKFSNLIGLIMATLLLALVALMLFKRYEKLKEQEMQQAAAAAGAQQGSEEKDEKEEDEEDHLGAGAGGPLSDEESSLYSGIERFKTFLSNSPVEASLLVKKWITTDGKSEQEALIALVQQMENDELKKIFDHLSLEERNNWKKLINKVLSKEELAAVNSFISSQIVEDIILPREIDDDEFCDLMLKIKPEQAVKFISENEGEGALFLNIMSTKFVSRILDSMPVELVNKVIDSSLNFDKKSIVENLASFKEKLKQYAESKAKNPFLEKVVELIPMATPVKEGALYLALAKGGEETIMFDLAVAAIPSDLIPQLSDNVTKYLLQKYPMSRKVELLAHLKEADAQLRERMIEIYAPVGSPARDMLDLEFEKVETDFQLRKKLKEEGDLIWKDFVDYTRKVLKTETQFRSDLEELVGEWAKDLIAKHFNRSSNTAAKEAA